MKKELFEKTIRGDWVLKEFRNKAYEGRLFRLEQSGIIFQLHPKYGIRCWLIGNCIMNQTQLGLIDSIVAILKDLKEEEDEKEN